MQRTTWLNPGPQRYRQGFTLAELLGGVIAATIFVAGATGIVVQLLISDRREAARTEIQSEMQAALNFIAADLRQAVYVYNDEWSGGTRFNNPTSATTRTGSPDGTPDLNQILRASPEGASLIPTGSLTGVDWQRPVLAFWRVANLPANCRPTVPPSEESTEPYRSADQVAAQTRLARMGVAFELVVYNLKLNRGYHIPTASSPDPTWGRAGQGRILRQVYRPHVWSDCFLTISGRPATEPLGPSDENPIVNASYILPEPPFFSRWPLNLEGQIVTILGTTLTADPTGAAAIRSAELGAGGPQGGGGFTPVEVLATFLNAPTTPPPPPTCPAGYIVGSNLSMLGFYACVGLRNSVTDPTGSQDVIVHLMGNAWGRAGFDPNTACTLQSDPGYCPVVSRQVFIPAHFRRQD